MTPDMVLRRQPAPSEARGLRGLRFIHEEVAEVTEIITALWQRWTEEKQRQDRAAPLRATLEARWERMRARLDDLPAALRGRDLLVRDLEQALRALDVTEWRTSNAALKRVEETARLLRMTDQALVELEAAGASRGVRPYLIDYLIRLHFTVIDADDPSMRAAIKNL